MSILHDVDLVPRLRDVRHLLRRHVHLSAPYRIGSYSELFAAALWPPGGFAAPYGLGSTFVPGASASCPVTTTVSSGWRPLSTTMRSPSCRCPGFTGRRSTVLSGFNTNMNGPLWLIWTACDGTSRASLIVSRMKRTRTNSNGQNAWSGFGVTPRAFTVPEPGWTAVSMKYKSPTRGGIFSSGKYVCTFTFGPPRYFRTNAKSVSATVKSV